LIRSLRATLNPAHYHGHGRQPPFFEGWYYKLVDASERHRYAVIPGIFVSHDPEAHHAFVQILDGQTGQVDYHRFPPNEFWAAEDEFDLLIGSNRFREDSLSLDIGSPHLGVSGELCFRNTKPWPVTLLSPGIMGWYAWVPSMECYHGVLSLDHEIEGELFIKGQQVGFSGGRGYTEKDWGRSFPAAWVWLQTNHFADPGISLTASVAIIPWGRRSFPGFIIGFWHERVLYRFATYTGAKIDTLDITDDTIHWIVRDKRRRLEMEVARAEGGLLQAPTTVDMGRRIAETISGEVSVKLYSLDKSGTRPLFRGLGRHAGLEAAGDLARLRGMWASEARGA
jgi:hypothetical protein